MRDAILLAEATSRVFLILSKMTATDDDEEDEEEVEDEDELRLQLGLVLLLPLLLLDGDTSACTTPRHTTT